MLPVFVDSDLFTYVREVPKEGPLSVEQRSTISLIIEKIYKQHQASELFDGLTKLVDDLFTKLTSRKGDELELQAVKLANAFKSTTLFNLPPELVSSILTFLPPKDVFSSLSVCRYTKKVIDNDLQLQYLVSDYRISRLKLLSLVHEDSVIVEKNNKCQSLTFLSDSALWAVLHFSPQSIQNATCLSVKCNSLEVINTLFHTLQESTQLHQLIIYADPPPTDRTLRIKPTQQVTTCIQKQSPVANSLNEIQILQGLLTTLMDLDVRDEDKLIAINELPPLYKQKIMQNFWDSQNNPDNPDYLSRCEQLVQENPSSPFLITAIRRRLEYLAEQKNVRSKGSEITLISE